jgi:hypothetical protein
MTRWCAKVGSHDVSDSLWPKKGRARSDFIEPTAHHVDGVPKNLSYN